MCCPDKEHAIRGAPISPHAPAPLFRPPPPPPSRSHALSVARTQQQSRKEQCVSQVSAAVEQCVSCVCVVATCRMQRGGAVPRAHLPPGERGERVSVSRLRPTATVRPCVPRPTRTTPGPRPAASRVCRFHDRAVPCVKKPCVVCTCSADAVGSFVSLINSLTSLFWQKKLSLSIHVHCTLKTGARNVFHN